MKRRSSLSFALTGGTWFVYLKGYNLSVATAVGFVALAGVAAELGVVVMLLHLKHATAAQIENGPPLTSEVLDENVRDGAVFRVRPNEMIVAGLLPIFWGSGAGPPFRALMRRRA
jgi:copper/silver efflux system protein